MPAKHRHELTKRILYGMLGGVIFGIILNLIIGTGGVQSFSAPVGSMLAFIVSSLEVVGRLFLNGIQMLVVPVVFFSLVSATANLSNPKTLGRIGLKTVGLYIITTVFGLVLALLFANLVGVGSSLQSITASNINIDTKMAGSITDLLSNLLPSNPVAAMAEGRILPLILFSILFGVAIAFCRSKADGVKRLFNELETVTMRLFMIIMQIAPYGVFGLLATHFVEHGWQSAGPLLGFMLTTLAVLIFYLFAINSAYMVFLAKLDPRILFKKIASTMLFAFSTSSSNASIPIVIDAVENKLGIKNTIAAFTIPLGATINMNGTAIMQAVVTVFIANYYGIDLSFADYLIVVVTATLAAIGTAGVPSVGIITLALVLQQVGLPVEGIALVIGVERILDMVRTAVNVTGDIVTTCIVAKSEGGIDEAIYNDMEAGEDD